MRHYQHKIGRFEHRGEHLAASDAISAGDLPRPRFQRTLADQRRRDRLGEIAGDQLALLYDKLGDCRLVSFETSALSNIGMTTEACMLKASAVDGHPWPSIS